MSARRFAWLPGRRLGNALGFAACAGMLCFGLYLQHVKDIQPCPLCMIQRLMFVVTGIAFLVAALHHPARIGARVYGGLIALLALTGAAVAGRHVWLQYIPPERRPSCGPGLEYLLSTFGPLGSLGRILRGSGECGAVDWTLLSFSIPEWSLSAFTVFTIWALLLAFRD